MRVCEHCQCKYSDPYLKYCKTCYYGIKSKGLGFKKRLRKVDSINTKCCKCSKLRIKLTDIEKDLCRNCYQQERIRKNPIIGERHKKITRDYQRRKRGIDTELPLLNAPSGSGHIGKNGYKKICKLELRGHPNADKKGALYEHTYVMSKELVHHKNGIRHDNRIENLELCHIGQPSGQRVEDKINWCIEFLNIYGYDINKR